MRIYSVLGITCFWVVWQVVWMCLSIQQFINVTAIRLPEADLSFEKSDSVWKFAEPGAAFITLKLTADFNPRGPVELLFNVADEQPVAKTWPEGEKVLEVELPISNTNIPAPGETRELLISAKVVTGPAKAEIASHTAVVRNSTPVSATATWIAADENTTLYERQGDRNVGITTATYTIQITPPREAALTIKIAGDAQRDVDFRLVSPENLTAGSNCVLTIPESGTARLEVQTLTNSKSLNRRPRRLQLTFAAAPTDKLLSLAPTSRPLELAIENTDLAQVVIQGQDAPKLFESNPSAEVTLRISTDSPLEEPLSIAWKIEGSSSLKPDDYAVSPKSVQLTKDARQGTITLNPIDDDIPEGTENLIVKFLDGPGYAIRGNREFTVPIEDNDRRLVVKLDERVLEGNRGLLKLSFDPPSDTPTPVQIRLLSQDSRLVWEDSRQQLVPLGSDAENKPVIKVTAPGEYYLHLQDDLKFQATSDFNLEVLAKNEPFSVMTSNYSLKLIDNDIDGNVIVVVLATQYMRSRLLDKDGILRPDGDFLEHFKDRRLPAGKKLIGNTYFLVGKQSPDSAARKSFWWKDNTAASIEHVGAFLKNHSLVDSAGDAPECLIDSLSESISSIGKLAPLLHQKSNETDLIVIWPSDSPPTTEACRAASLPALAGQRDDQFRSHFLWLHGKKGELFETFPADNPPLSGFYDHFPRRRETLDELPRDAADGAMLMNKLEKFLQSQKP